MIEITKRPNYNVEYNLDLTINKYNNFLVIESVKSPESRIVNPNIPEASFITPLMGGINDNFLSKMPSQDFPTNLTAYRE